MSLLQPEASTSRQQPPPPRRRGPNPPHRPRWQQYGGVYRSIDDLTKPWLPSPSGYLPLPLPDVVPVFNLDLTVPEGASPNSSLSSAWSRQYPVIPPPSKGTEGVLEDSSAPKRTSSVRRFVKRLRLGSLTRRKTETSVDCNPSTNPSLPSAKALRNSKVRAPVDNQDMGSVQPHEWKAYGYYARPIIGDVQVHNSSSPPTTHAPLQHIDDTDLTPEDVFFSLESPDGTPHPERWKLGIEHPSLPPRPTRWTPPDPSQPLPFPWEVQLNPFLEHILFGVPRLYWDIKEDISAVLYGLQADEDPGEVSKPLSPADLAQPATWPFVTHMYVNALADDMAQTFFWPFMVINPHGIKVRDVLESVYANFREAVRPEEYWSAKWTTPRRKEAARAHRRRTDPTSMENQWKAAEGGVDVEDGIRRIDYLGYRTMFRGLAPNPDATGWVLYLGQD